MQLIAARAERGIPRPVEAELAAAPLIDLKAALEACVADAKQHAVTLPPPL